MPKQDDFTARLDKAKQQLHHKDAPNPSAKAGAQGLAAGWRLAMELFAALATGGFIGYWLDRGLGTSPLWLLLLTFLGAGAGVWRVYRESSEANNDANKKDRP